MFTLHLLQRLEFFPEPSFSSAKIITATVLVATTIITATVLVFFLQLSHPRWTNQNWVWNCVNQSEPITTHRRWILPALTLVALCGTLRCITVPVRSGNRIISPETVLSTRGVHHGVLLVVLYQLKHCIKLVSAPLNSPQSYKSTNQILYNQRWCFILTIMNWFDRNMDHLVFWSHRQHVIAWTNQRLELPTNQNKVFTWNTLRRSN